MKSIPDITYSILDAAAQAVIAAIPLPSPSAELTEIIHRLDLALDSGRSDTTESDIDRAHELIRHIGVDNHRSR